MPHINFDLKSNLYNNENGICFKRQEKDFNYPLENRKWEKNEKQSNSKEKMIEISTNKIIITSINGLNSPIKNSQIDYK